MSVLVTGAFGRVGTALIDHSEAFKYTYFDRTTHPNFESVLGNVSDLSTIETAIENHEQVAHLAAVPHVDAAWDAVLENNIIGAYNCLEACRRNRVDSVVLASSNHVVGMYEKEHAPELYRRDYELTLDHMTPTRPDSYYGTSKCFAESLGRYYVENHEFPRRVYVLRIGSVRRPRYDHPYGDAEKGVEDGDWTRDSEEYDRLALRMKAMWQSRRDIAHQIDCCLTDETITFDIFYGVSDNERSWFDLERARERIGYQPKDSGDEWTAPPDRDPSPSDTSYKGAG